MHKQPNCLGEVANNLRGGMDSWEIEIIADLKGKQPMLVQMNVNSEKQSKAKNHWTKSLEGWAKLNFAAGFNEQSNSGS
jgi:hypothetical protein